MVDLTEDQLRQIIREEINGELKGIHVEQTGMRAEQATMQTNQTSFRSELDSFRTELFRLGVLMEDVDNKLDTALEMLGANLKVKRRVDVHEERLDDVEAEQTLLKSTVALHSRQTQSDVEPAIITQSLLHLD